MRGPFDCLVLLLYVILIFWVRWGCCWVQKRWGVRLLEGKSVIVCTRWVTANELSALSSCFPLPLYLHLHLSLSIPFKLNYGSIQSKTTHHFLFRTRAVHQALSSCHLLLFVFDLRCLDFFVCSLFFASLTVGSFLWVMSFVEIDLWQLELHLNGFVLNWFLSFKRVS